MNIKRHFTWHYTMITHYWSHILQSRDLITELDLLPKLLRGFHETFAMGVACRQGTLTPPDIFFRPIWDLHLFYLSIPILFPNLSWFTRTMRFEHPSLLSWFEFIPQEMDLRVCLLTLSFRPKSTPPLALIWPSLNVILSEDSPYWIYSQLPLTHPITGCRDYRCHREHRK